MLIMNRKCKIKIFKREDRLNIFIIDTGIGIAHHKLLVLRKKLADNQRFEHIGLYNTNKRLQLLYNFDYKFTIRSKQHYGTCVHIVLPCEITNS